jgi:DeoR family glycerol-3-phosphate regulon repressor
VNIEERQDRIADLVRTRKRVKSHVLTDMFGVSLETIRKDLQELQARGVLIRVHGGAKAAQDGHESAYQRRLVENMAAKEAIARLAAEGVSEGSTVYLDYGTTTYALASALVRSGRELTVLTNSLPIVNRLAESDRISTVVLGGILRRNERSLFGPIAESTLRTVYMDAGFFGCAGIHPTAGLTNHHPIEAAASRLAMSHCSTVTVLADGDKLETIAHNQVAGIHDVDLLITDSAPSAEFSAELDSADVTVLIAPVPEEPGSPT